MFTNLLKKILKISFYLVLIAIPLNISFTKVYSLQITLRSGLNIDETLSSDDNYYSNAEEILIVPIKIDKALSLNEAKWYQGIYYYIVDRLGLSDMPYHYLVTESGNVLKGNKFGDEKRTSLVNFNSNSIIIGYLYKNNSTTFDPRAEQPLREVISEVANANNVNPNKTSVRDLRFKRDKENKRVEIFAEKSFGNWENSTARIVSGITNFTPISKVYSVEVLEIITPTEEVEPGELIDISVKLKNTSVSGNYAGSNSELILTKNGSGASQFYANNIWLSQTQTAIMKESQNFLPNQEVLFTFKVKAPIFVGRVAESFSLKTFAGGNVTSTSNIDFALNIKRTDKQIIEIKNTGFTFVNVYSQPSSSSAVLRRVVPGERFFLISLNSETLWTNIDLGNGENGWIAAWNFNYL